MAEVQLEADLAHPPERVWQALTDARLLGEWFMPTDLEPMEGARFTLDPGPLAGFLGPVSGELLELVPVRRMVMRWQGESLHTRVAWELTETSGGCRLRLLQSGFVGAPATVRRRALRATYLRLITEQLPELLDQLAGGRVGRPTAPTIPQQRRPPELAGPAGAAPPDPPARRRGGRVRAGLARGRGWLGVIPAWGRALVVGTSAALLVLVVLAGITQTWSPWPGRGGGAGPEEQRDGPGLAAQPGAGAARTTTDPLAPAGGPVPGTAATAVPESAATPEPGVSPASPRPAGDGRSPASGESSPPATNSDGGPSSGEQPPATELTAAMATASRLLGLGGRTVSVTVANPGPGEAATWEVTMDVGEQDVTNVTGAAYERSGSQASFTPAGEALSVGGSVEFSFDIPGDGLAGLGGASDPTGCTIDGRPCE